MIKFWPLTWNYVVIMFNANQSQNLILITWPNMSALRPKMGNPPPYQGIPYTITPSSSHLCLQKKIVNLPYKLCREEHLFLILPRDHNKGYNIPPRLSPPVKGILNRRRVSESPFCKARLQTTWALVGQLCMRGDLPRVQLSIFAIITCVSRTTLFR